MDIIHLLPDHVANQIAAGEVIQRPASCLKELVENSLDAGATHIQVVVRDAGRTILQVVDNGSGMSETDVRMAFERHATSKLRDVSDLFDLRTMGFRGEALASICAVAQVEVTTRRREDELGTSLLIHGSTLVSQEPCTCAVGTNIKVKNLFYNVPVRRKFLKTDATELRNLLTEFFRIVLVYPKVQFTFVSNDEILFELPASTEKQRIEAIFGKSNARTTYSSQLLDVKTDTELVSIRGFVANPESCGKTAQQYFFVNGRYMRHPYFHKAVLGAYTGMLPGDYQPSYFIYFDIRPDLIDVNIHPTKTEIKFADEQSVFHILMAAIRESLGKFTLVPTIDFDRSGEIEMPVHTSPQTTPVQAPQIVYNPNYTPFVKSSYTPSFPSSQATPVVDAGADLLAHQSPLLLDADTPVQQYAGKYIFVPTESGIVVVNQHRAHVLVLYHQLLGQLESHQGASQQLLFPEVIGLSADEMAVMAVLLTDLRAIGWELEQFSPSSYSVTGLPAGMEPSQAVATLRSILGSVRERGGNLRSEYRQSIALMQAKAAAIPYGKRLSEEEMRDLVKRLSSLASYRVTPDGKPVVSLWSTEELDRRFQ